MIKAANPPRILPLLILCLVIFTLAAIPFRIIELKYMPGDDALRHAAKAVSGKSWDQILVLRDDVKLDTYAGWHAILGFVHKALDFDAYQLVIFSVFILFLVYSLVPVLLLERPEAWALALLVMCVADPLMLTRLLLGRPYLATMAAIAATGFLWQGLAAKKTRWTNFIILAAFMTLATWMHGGGCFFLMPVAAFFLAREWRAGILVALAAAIGVIAGSAMAGNPFIILAQTVRYVFLSLGHCKSQGLLVTELQPFIGDFPAVLAVVLMLMWRALRGDWDPKALNNPVGMLMLMSWALGFVTKRIWVDVGLAALLVWMALEFQEFLKKRMPFFSWRRLVSTAVLSLVLFFAFTNDSLNRWSSLRPRCLSFAEDAVWAPGPGGIVYNSDMGTFFGMFYKAPLAPWRYILGFEPGMMPFEDLAIYRKIQERPVPESFAPWVAKMRPEDRLIVINLSDKAPEIKELEWHNAENYYWIGRKHVKR